MVDLLGWRMTGLAAQAEHGPPTAKRIFVRNGLPDIVALTGFFAPITGQSAWGEGATGDLSPFTTTSGQYADDTWKVASMNPTIMTRPASPYARE